MPVSLVHMRELMAPGLWLWAHKNDPLQMTDFPESCVHVRNVFNQIPIKTVKDLGLIPNLIVGADGSLYESKTVFAGREYPQGWGRGPGGAAAELPPEPDGKVDIFKSESNEAMSALKAEISGFIDGKVKARGF